MSLARITFWPFLICRLVAALVSISVVDSEASTSQTTSIDKDLFGAHKVQSPSTHQAAQAQLTLAMVAIGFEMMAQDFEIKRDGRDALLHVFYTRQLVAQWRLLLEQPDSKALSAQKWLRKAIQSAPYLQQNTNAWSQIWARIHQNLFFKTYFKIAIESESLSVEDRLKKIIDFLLDRGTFRKSFESTAWAQLAIYSLYENSNVTRDLKTYLVRSQRFKEIEPHLPSPWSLIAGGVIVRGVGLAAQAPKVLRTASQLQKQGRMGSTLRPKVESAFGSLRTWTAALAAHLGLGTAIVQTDTDVANQAKATNKPPNPVEPSTKPASAVLNSAQLAQALFGLSLQLQSKERRDYLHPSLNQLNQAALELKSYQPDRLRLVADGLAALNASIGASKQVPKDFDLVRFFAEAEHYRGIGFDDIRHGQIVLRAISRSLRSQIRATGIEAEAATTYGIDQLREILNVNGPFLYYRRAFRSVSLSLIGFGGNCEAQSLVMFALLNPLRALYGEQAHLIHLVDPTHIEPTLAYGATLHELVSGEIRARSNFQGTVLENPYLLAEFINALNGQATIDTKQFVRVFDPKAASRLPLQLSFQTSFSPKSLMNSYHNIKDRLNGDASILRSKIPYSSDSARKVFNLSDVPEFQKRQSSHSGSSRSNRSHQNSGSDRENQSGSGADQRTREQRSGPLAAGGKPIPIYTWPLKVGGSTTFICWVESRHDFNLCPAEITASEWRYGRYKFVGDPHSNAYDVVVLIGRRFSDEIDFRQGIKIAGPFPSALNPAALTSGEVINLFAESELRHSLLRSKQLATDTLSRLSAKEEDKWIPRISDKPLSSQTLRDLLTDHDTGNPITVGQTIWALTRIHFLARAHPNKGLINFVGPLKSNSGTAQIPNWRITEHLPHIKSLQSLKGLIEANQGTVTLLNVPEHDRLVQFWQRIHAIQNRLTLLNVVDGLKEFVALSDEERASLVFIRWVMSAGAFPSFTDQRWYDLGLHATQSHVGFSIRPKPVCDPKQADLTSVADLPTVEMSPGFSGFFYVFPADRDPQDCIATNQSQIQQPKRRHRFQNRVPISESALLDLALFTQVFTIHWSFHPEFQIWLGSESGRTRLERYADIKARLDLLDRSPFENSLVSVAALYEPASWTVPGLSQDHPRPLRLTQDEFNREAQLRNEVNRTIFNLDLIPAPPASAPGAPGASAPAPAASASGVTDAKMAALCATSTTLAVLSKECFRLRSKLDKKD